MLEPATPQSLALRIQDDGILIRVDPSRVSASPVGDRLLAARGKLCSTLLSRWPPTTIQGQNAAPTFRAEAETDHSRIRCAAPEFRAVPRLVGQTTVPQFNGNSLQR